MTLIICERDGKVSPEAMNNLLLDFFPPDLIKADWKIYAENHSGPFPFFRYFHLVAKRGKTILRVSALKKINWQQNIWLSFRRRKWSTEGCPMSQSANFKVGFFYC